MMEPDRVLEAVKKLEEAELNLADVHRDRMAARVALEAAEKRFQEADRARYEARSALFGAATEGITIMSPETFFGTL